MLGRGEPFLDGKIDAHMTSDTISRKVTSLYMMSFAGGVLRIQVAEMC